jgi:hypothetical protein
MFNPCTGEDVLITGTFHYLPYRHGDRSHTSDATGIGLTSGAPYRFVYQSTETANDFFEVVRLISLGPESDLSFTDYLSDTIDPIVSCS